MRLRPFEFHSPTTLDECCRLLRSLPGEVKVLAGGTDLLADLKQGRVAADHVVSLRRIEAMRKIEDAGEAILIGPAVTPNRLARSELVKSELTALADAASVMGGNQIRNLATIGGNVASAVPSADLPPSLLVAEAVLEVTNGAESHGLPIRDFFLGPRETALDPGWMISVIHVPKLPPGTGTAYRKFQLRDASALAVVGVAARLTLEEGKVKKARLAVTAAAPAPFLVQGLGAMLKGREPDAEAIALAAGLARNAVSPISDLRGSAEYRRDLTEVLARRALEQALARARAGEAARC